MEVGPLIDPVPDGACGSTAIVNGSDVAVLPEVHVSLDVRVTLTTSPLTGVMVKVGLLPPSEAPFTLH